MNVNTDIVVPLPQKKVPQRDVKYQETFIPPETDAKVEVIGKNGSMNVEEPCPDVPDSGEDLPDLLPRTGGDTRTKYRTRGAVREEAKPTAKPRRSTRFADPPDTKVNHANTFENPTVYQKTTWSQQKLQDYLVQR